VGSQPLALPSNLGHEREWWDRRFLPRRNRTPQAAGSGASCPALAIRRGVWRAGYIEVAMIPGPVDSGHGTTLPLRRQGVFVGEGDALVGEGGALVGAGRYSIVNLGCSTMRPTSLISGNVFAWQVLVLTVDTENGSSAEPLPLSIVTGTVGGSADGTWQAASFAAAHRARPAGESTCTSSAARGYGPPGAPSAWLLSASGDDSASWKPMPPMAAKAAPNSMVFRDVPRNWFEAPQN